jgi:hydroxymethylbilane synthase
MGISIGTRGSKLALWQANHVKALLEASGHDVSIKIYKTTGDIQQDRPLHLIGEKGLFTKALDEGLINGEVDIAVHSSKDIPTRLPEGLEVCAFLEREDPRDVLLAMSPEVDLDNHSREFVVGTSSLRRTAFVGHYAPQFQTKLVRGNVDTRIAKMEAGEYDALILAYAGVKRMGRMDRVVRKLNVHTFTPAVGQGAIGVMARTDNPVYKDVREVLNHPETEWAVSAERAFLRRLEGGCHAPIYALGTITKDTLTLTGGVAAEDGSVVYRETVQGPVGSANDLGINLAEIVLNQGASTILHGKSS